MIDSFRFTPRPRSGRRRSLGQHFLAAGSVARVVEAIAPRSGDRFLEVGPGRGAISWPLLAAGVRILAVEIDPLLVRRLRQIAGKDSRLTVIPGDILKVDLQELLERELPPVTYWFRRDGRQVKKTVRWFLMRPLEKAGDHDHEVDEVLWTDKADALARLRYDSDRRLVGAVT